jgi:hypothetical protein
VLAGDLVEDTGRYVKHKAAHLIGVGNKR